VTKLSALDDVHLLCPAALVVGLNAVRDALPTHAVVIMTGTTRIKKALRAYHIAKTFTCIVLMCCLQTRSAFGQHRSITHQQQYWIGYISDTKVFKEYSLWNDFHYVPGSFLLARTGLSRSFKKYTMTGGYAFVWLPNENGKSLPRHEQRPWGQLQMTSSINARTRFTSRMRYEARFREKIANGQLLHGEHIFNHRLRMLVTCRRDVSILYTGEKIFVAASEEILLNAGHEAASLLDQNRLGVSIGVDRRNTQYQLGFMNRFVKTSQNRFLSNETVFFWVTQRLDFRNSVKGS
jgi:hypothetical protein